MRLLNDYTQKEKISELKEKLSSVTSFLLDNNSEGLKELIDLAKETQKTGMEETGKGIVGVFQTFFKKKQ